MKYQNLAAFQKHLQQSLATGLSRVFLVVSACPYERKKIVDEIVAGIQKKEKEATRNHSSIENIKELISELNTLSLFSVPKILYWDEVDRLKKIEMEPLIRYVESPSHFSYLILGAATSKGLSDLYTKGKKELIACDLSEEKPWELKARLKLFAQEKARSLGKQFEVEGLDLLLERVGFLLPSLEQEVDKLICYLGERKVITAQDVRLLVAEQTDTYLFDLIDCLIWTDKRVSLTVEEVEGLFFPLLSQLKTQLQQAIVVAHLLAKALPKEEIPPYLPQIKSFVIDKLISKVRPQSLPFLRGAINEVFKIELLSKNGSFEPSFLFDLLTAKFSYLKYALSSTQSSIKS